MCNSSSGENNVNHASSILTVSSEETPWHHCWQVSEITGLMCSDSQQAKRKRGTIRKGTEEQAKDVPSLLYKTLMHPHYEDFGSPHLKKNVMQLQKKKREEQ